MCKKKYQHNLKREILLKNAIISNTGCFDNKINIVYYKTNKFIYKSRNPNTSVIEKNMNTKDILFIFDFMTFTLSDFIENIASPQKLCIFFK